MSTVHQKRARSLAVIREAYAAGKLGQATKYLHKGNPCAIGCLFTPAQQADIKQRHLNSATIENVARHIGTKNLVEVTGFSLRTLQKIQQAHDSWAGTPKRNGKLMVRRAQREALFLARMHTLEVQYPA